MAALRAFVGMVDAGFGLGPRRTLVGAAYVLQANRAWSPVPDNDPEGARRWMHRFYELVAAHSTLSADPVRSAELEVRWWHLHRQHQYSDEVSRDDLVRALVDLYAHVYDADPETMVAAASHRVEAMDLSDAWVATGCRLDDPALAAERRALVASYSALLDAVGRTSAEARPT